MNNLQGLKISHHINAPLFQKEGNPQAILKDLISELVSSNGLILNDERAEYFKQAGLVNLFFFLKIIAGDSCPYDELSMDLHRDVCNFYQEMVFPGSRAFILLPRGHGKSLVKGEKVITDKGLKLVEDLKNGDCLFGVDDKLKPIKTWIVNLSKDISNCYELSLRSGRKIKVADDHKVLKLGQYISVKDLSINDRIAVLTDFSPYKEQLDISWLKGMLYGDGCLTKVTPILSIFDKQLLKKVREVWEDGLYNKKHNYYTIRNSTKLNLPIANSYSKTFPNDMYGDSMFLRGLFDSDGTVNIKSKIISFCSVSKNLAYGVMLSLQSLGIFSSINIKKTVSKKAYRVSIFGKNNQDKFKNLVSFYSLKKLKKLNKLNSIGENSHIYGTVPKEWRTMLNYGDGWKLRQAGLRIDNKYATTKSKLLGVGDKTLNTNILTLATSPIVWDFVKEIKPIGKQNIIHIEVDGYHNYIDSMGIVTHNTKIGTEGGSAWDIIRNPNITIKIVNAKADIGKMFMNSIERIFDSNPLFERLYPDFVPSANIRRWNDNEMVIPCRTKQKREATVSSGGIGGASEGLHYDVLKVDDMFGLKALDSGLTSGAEMERAKNWFKTQTASLLNSPKRSRVWGSGTRYSIDDGYHDILSDCKQFWGSNPAGYDENDEGDYQVYYRPAIEDGKPILPEFYDMSFYNKMAIDDPWTFACQYMNNPSESGITEFNMFKIKECKIDVDKHGDWYIIYFLNGMDVNIPLRNCDVIIACDPGATEKFHRRKSRTAVGVLATHSDGKKFFIHINAGHVKPSIMFDWLFSNARKFSANYRRTIVETQGAFKILEPLLRDEQKRRKEYIKILTTSKTGEKDTVIRNTLEPEFKRGNIYVEKHCISLVSTELACFPQGSQKDVLDMMALAINNSNRPHSREERVEKRRRDEKRRNRHVNVAGY